MRFTFLAFASVTLLLGLAIGCDDEPDPTATCDEQIDEYSACIDDFCAGEGSGSSYCDCWRQRYGVRAEGCVCTDEIWLVSARGLCASIGAEAYSRQVDCERGIDFAREWIADCG